MSKSIKILLSTALSLLMISAIFFFSEQTGSSSHEESQKVSDIIAAGLTNMEPSVTYTQDDVAVISKALDYPIRKFAHFFIYFSLGLIIYVGFHFVLAKQIRPRHAFIVILLVFLIASSDEINQYFKEGRGASFGDVLLDTWGGTLGVYFFHIVKDFVSHLKSLFHKP